MQVLFDPRALAVRVHWHRTRPSYLNSFRPSSTGRSITSKMKPSFSLRALFESVSSLFRISFCEFSQAGTVLRASEAVLVEPRLVQQAKTLNMTARSCEENEHRLENRLEHRLEISGLSGLEVFMSSCSDGSARHWSWLVERLSLRCAATCVAWNNWIRDLIRDLFYARHCYASKLLKAFESLNPSRFNDQLREWHLQRSRGTFFQIWQPPGLSFTRLLNRFLFACFFVASGVIFSCLNKEHHAYGRHLPSWSSWGFSDQLPIRLVLNALGGRWVSWKAALGHHEHWVVADGNDGHLFHAFVRAMDGHGIDALEPESSFPNLRPKIRERTCVSCR